MHGHTRRRMRVELMIDGVAIYSHTVDVPPMRQRSARCYARASAMRQALADGAIDTSMAPHIRKRVRLLASTPDLPL